MTIKKQKVQRFGKKTALTLNVSYTCSIMAFAFAMFCFFYLDIKGAIFQILLIFSVLNSINTLLFFRHRRLELMYNIMSVLAFVTNLALCMYSGGINSPFTSFLVIIIFAGYATNGFYGNLWLGIVSITAVLLYYISRSGIMFTDEVSEGVIDEFNFFFLLFLIVLLGGVFGRLLNKNNEKMYKAKKELIQRDEEKAVMLKEIHHRVKNNLHVVNSLLRIQSRNIEDHEVKMMFKVAQSRIVAMARLHEKIYNTNNLKHIDVNDYFKLLINDLINSYNIETKIVLDLSIDEAKISIDSLLPLSLIINELISNSLKHAFNEMDTGRIEVKLRNEGNKNYELIVGDNGKGVASNLFSTTLSSTGTKLINTFIKQLSGSIDLLEGKKGTHFRILFTDDKA